MSNSLSPSSQLIDRSQGCFLGLALGDALGTTLEFCAKDTYEHLQDMVGGGPFRLSAGQWTDDTSMALCLSDSLLACGKHDASDQMDRYLRWFKQGENSVTGRCFDIGNTVRGALRRYQETGQAYAGSTHPDTAGNGSLMRLAPVCIFNAPYKGVSIEAAIEAAAKSSLTTHQERRAIEACQVMAWLIYHVFDEAYDTKLALFNGLQAYGASADFSQDITQITSGSYCSKTRDMINGTGFVVDSLEAALWCFANSSSFEQGALLAANLGEDADTTAAIYGMLAGAFYGKSGLPAKWLEKLAWCEHIETQAELLCVLPLVDF